MPLKHKRTELSAEDLAVVAEKGLAAARLNKRQLKALLSGGLKEVYALRELHKAVIPPLEKREVDRLMDRFFPEAAEVREEAPLLWVKVKETAVEMLQAVSGGWQMGSPAFSYRGAEQRTVVLQREVGRVTVHVEITSRPNRLVDIRLLLADETNRDRSSFEVELFKNSKCIEAVNGKSEEIVTIERVEPGEYRLRMSDVRGEIAGLSIRID